MPADTRGPLEAKVPYLSPYHRVRQSGDLHTWARGLADPGGAVTDGRRYVRRHRPSHAGRRPVPVWRPFDLARRGGGRVA